MSTLPTDKQLKKRAEKLVSIPFSMYLATLEALNVDRESLRLLLKCQESLGIPVQLTPSAESHIAVLKGRLGITD